MYVKRGKKWPKQGARRSMKGAGANLKKTKVRSRRGGMGVSGIEGGEERGEG